MKKRIIILVAIAIIVILSLSCSTSSVTSLFATNTPTPTLTFTPTNTPTPKPTKTSTPTLVPTVTKTPIAGLIGPEGWDSISSDHVILFVPPEYIGGKIPIGDYGIEAMVDMMADFLRLINGTDAEVEMVLDLWGLDLDNIDSSSTFVVLRSDNTDTAFNMESTGRDFGNLLEYTNMYEVEHGLVELEHTSVYGVRIFDESAPMMSKYYFAEHGDNFYMIMFVTLINDFEEIEQDFDLIIQSIYFID